MVREVSCDNIDLVGKENSRCIECTRYFWLLLNVDFKERSRKEGQLLHEHTNVETAMGHHDMMV